MDKLTVRGGDPLDLTQFDGHTPGPWSVPHFADADAKCACGYVFAREDAKTVCEVNYHDFRDKDDQHLPRAEAAANARLIAAAPRLLEAAEADAKRLREAGALALKALYRCHAVMTPMQVVEVGIIGEAIQQIQALEDAALAGAAPATDAPDMDEREAGEKCDVCGRRYLTVYRVPDSVWLEVTVKAPGGLLCPECCDRLAREAGYSLYWEARDDYFPTESTPTAAPATDASGEGGI